MGNCQTIETVETTVVVLLHPGDGGKVEKMHWSVSGNEIMSLNPGFYVALVIQPCGFNNDGQILKNDHLKLLRPDDTLHVGHVYRLVSFEDVIKDFTVKKSEKLGQLGGCRSSYDNTQTRNDLRGGQNHSGRGQWRPALQSIAEV